MIHPGNLVLLFMLMNMCACHRPTRQEEILKTSNEVISALKENRESDFNRLIGVKLDMMGKDEELLHWDYTQMRELISKYSNFDLLPIRITNEFNNSRLLVEIPVFKRKDTLSNIKEVKLILFFGPPQLVPLNKISGYDLIVER